MYYFPGMPFCPYCPLWICFNSVQPVLFRENHVHKSKNTAMNAKKRKRKKSIFFSGKHEIIYQQQFTIKADGPISTVFGIRDRFQLLVRFSNVQNCSHHRMINYLALCFSTKPITTIEYSYFPFFLRIFLYLEL